MEITEIKQQLTLAEVLKHYGLKPDKSLLDILDYVDPGNSENLNFRKALYSS